MPHEVTKAYTLCDYFIYLTTLLYANLIARHFFESWFRINWTKTQQYLSKFTVHNSTSNIITHSARNPAFSLTNVSPVPTKFHFSLNPIVTFVDFAASDIMPFKVSRSFKVIYNGLIP